MADSSPLTTLVVGAVLLCAVYLLLRRYWGFWDRPIAAGLSAASTVPSSRQAAFDQSMAPVSALVSKPGNRLLLTYRGDTLIALIASAEAPQDDIIHSRPNNEMAALISQAEVTRVLVRKLHASGRIGRPIEVGAVLTPGLGEYALVKGWLDRHVSLARRPFDRSRPFREVYFDYLERLAGSLELIDFIHLAYADVRNQIAPGAVPTAPPFDEPKSLPPYIPKRPGRRSALFLHNAYYHYNHLSEALRARDWDTLTVSLEPLDSANRQYMHGEDLCLHDADPDTMSRKVRDFLRTNADRFGVLQFTGQGVATLFVDNIESAADPILIPWDLMELRRRGVIVGYTPSGCLDGVSQTAIRVISQGVCGRCIWETRPDVCNDDKNLTWARKLDSFCDWVGLEADWAAEARVGPRFVKPPLITAMDPDVWRPDITPPREMIVKRAPDEFLIYHAVGNYSTRRTHEHDIKGTGAVLSAIERLKSEGWPVKLIFATEVASTQVKFLQVQADLVVDQLNYGRHGANARECMMLGKPVVAWVDPNQQAPTPPLAYLEESPAVRAGELTIYEVIKALIQDQDRLVQLGAASRAYAIKWHARDVCAVRYERVIDRVAAGLQADSEEVYA